jgi:hypothetical protein
MPQKPCWQRISFLSITDPSARSRNFWQALRGQTSEINNEGLTVDLHGDDVAVSTGIYRGKGMPSGKPFFRPGALRTSG